MYVHIKGGMGGEFICITNDFLYLVKKNCTDCFLKHNNIKERLQRTWKFCSKQDPSSSITGGVWTELLSQQSDGAERKSLRDADGSGEADHTCSDHCNPDSLHPGQDSSWR